MRRPNMPKCSSLVLGILVLTSGLGCGGRGDIVGGPCSYKDFTGTATITELKPEGAGYRMLFDSTFSGDQPNSLFSKNYEHATIQNSAGPTDPAWLTSQGLTVGAKLAINVSLITSGTCSPVIVRFPKLPKEIIKD